MGVYQQKHAIQLEHQIHGQKTISQFLELWVLEEISYIRSVESWEISLCLKNGDIQILGL